MDRQRPVQLLDAIVGRRAVPHALLFTGDEGAGKQAAAWALAQVLNCPVSGLAANDAAGAKQPPTACGNCRSCRKIASGNHPDMLSVQPSGPFIRIDQIRELIRTLAMKPYEASHRVAVIGRAHCMNPEAGNALLKMLEEPPARTILILTATGTAEMLPTIVSRCRHIRFHPVSPRRLAQVLEEAHDIEAHSAYRLAVLSAGSLDGALALARENWLERRGWLMRCAGLPASGGEPVLPAPPGFDAAATLSADKTHAMTALDVLQTVYRDMLVSEYRPDSLLNADLKEDILQAAARYTEAGMLAAVRAIDSARDRILANANPRLVLETLFLKLAKKAQMD